MRGLTVALLEKGDFCHATSAASSKLIHGGLRYLRNFELSLVRESLRERRTWEVIAPHLVDPLPTLLPVYKRKGSPGKLMLRIGLTLYDLLAFDRNRLEDEDKKLPAHRVLDRDAALETEPGLPPDDLVGAIVYYDCQMYSPERLCLENILAASERGAQVANYTEVTGFVMDEGAVLGVHVRDCLSEATFTVRGRVTVNASGPWADRLLQQLPDIAGSTRIVRSKGIHVITRPLTQHAIIMEHAGAHFFLLPWRGHTLIGTTDTVFADDPDAFCVTETDIVEFLAVINAGFPAARLERSDVQYFYGGMRPLVESEGAPGDTYEASRRSEVCDHERADGVRNLVSALGGKWTTSRHLAEQVVDRLGRKLGRAMPACATDCTLLPGGGVGRYAAYLEQARLEHGRWPHDVVDNLVRNYGSRYQEVLSLAEDNPAWGRPLTPSLPDIGAQVVHAVREEMARTLEDVVFRRTGLGTLGSPGPEALALAADLMGDLLQWDASEQRAQIERVLLHYQPGGGRVVAPDRGSK
jgi:glycerol-3-phosphate dehydrogenase